MNPTQLVSGLSIYLAYTLINLVSDRFTAEQTKFLLRSTVLFIRFLRKCHLRMSRSRLNQGSKLQNWKGYYRRRKKNLR